MLELHSRRVGEADRPGMLLLHGLFGSSANWGSIARRLADRFYVLVPDLRNHGLSPHAAQHTYPDMVDDVLGLLDRERIERTILVGHSMGGKVAMHLALQHTQRVRGMVAVDMSPVRYTHDFAAVLAGFRAVDLGSIGSRQDAERQMAQRVASRGVRAFLLQNLVREQRGWAWRLNLDALAAAQADIVGFPEQGDAVYEGPAGFIHGALSDYVEPRHEPTIRQLFPAARLCRVAGAGHWVYADQPDGFMRCLQAFLATVDT